MNKAITDGVLLMPPAFENGLDVWSSQDGTPGSDTYLSAANTAFVPADQDFGGCLEMQKTESVQPLRYMGETPLLPGCYLRVTVRVKAISGALPAVRIAGWAGASGGVHVAGLVETGPSVALQSYGQVVEVSAIIGAGNRNGVDMVWGSQPIYGHFGLDLTGANGGIVRIDDIVIEDITSVFLRDMMDIVDVRDYGAVGDGVTDDSAAFEAADAAANGRSVLVSKGSYFLGDSVTFESHVRFEGTVTMPDNKILSLTKDYHLPAYIDAFGNEVLAFKKAFQALLENSDHESLDLGGRRIQISAPIDMQAASATRTEYAQRRVIRNGQFYVENSSNWDDTVVTSSGTYTPSNPFKLTNVVNVANVPLGALVQANGVGREVYVRSKTIATQEVTLSQPLYDAQGTQNYTFRRFKYILDFNGFEKLTALTLSDIEFQCSGRASAVILPPSGLILQFRDCFFTRPKDRGISSPGEACQGMLIDRCQFLSDQAGMRAQDRTSVAFNTNGSDVKVRDCRATQFLHFGVMAGTSSVVTGNHFFQGDNEANGVRTGGLVITATNCRATINGNYIDNCFIEWGNEHDAEPAFVSGLPFSGMSIANNIFQSIDSAPWARFIVVKPYGSGHYVSGMNVTGNIFRSIHGALERVEQIDTTFAAMDLSRFRDISFKGNMFTGITTGAENPVLVEHVQNTAASTWVVDCAGPLPFGGYTRNIESVVAVTKIKNAVNVANYAMPYADVEEGANRDQVNLLWPEPVTGTVKIMVRIDV